MAEVVVPPRSGLIGQTTFPGMVTESGDLVVARGPAAMTSTRPATPCSRSATRCSCSGDWEALEHHLDDPDVLVVDAPETVRRQAVPLGPGAKRAIVVLAAMVVLLATGAVPPAVAGLLAAGAIILARVLTIEQAYRGIGWTTVILVGRDDPAVDRDDEHGRGRARLPTDSSDVVGGHGPHLLLFGIVPARVRARAADLATWRRR